VVNQADGDVGVLLNNGNGNFIGQVYTIVPPPAPVPAALLTDSGDTWLVDWLGADPKSRRRHDVMAP